jgi:uncharacterized protein YdeI (YjbR/CyaY-like superfamily)
MLQTLRTMMLQAGLTEECKWGVPCFSFANRNVVMLFVFKDSCGLSFFRGDELHDPANRLEAAGPNSRSGRLFRVTEPQQIILQDNDIRQWLTEAIALEEQGRPIQRMRADADLPEVPIWHEYLQSRPELAAAFEALTPGRKRGYLLHFATAKQESTRIKRMEKWTSQILALKGLHD